MENSGSHDFRAFIEYPIHLDLICIYTKRVLYNIPIGVKHFLNNNICHNQHHKNLAKTHTNNITYWQICQHLAKIIPTKISIVEINIPHAPTEVGILESIILSHTSDEAMSVGLAKACVP